MLGIMNDELGNYEGDLDLSASRRLNSHPEVSKHVTLSPAKDLMDPVAEETNPASESRIQK